MPSATVIPAAIAYLNNCCCEASYLLQRPLGSGWRMVAKLKLKGIDGMAGVAPAA